MDRDERDERQRRPKPRDPSELKNDRIVTGWGTTLVALFIGAAIVGNIMSLRRRLANIHRFGEGNSARSGANARQNNTGFQQQGRSKQQQQQQQEDETEASRTWAEHRRIWAEHVRQMEQLRRRQEAFDRERMRYKRNYDSWQERHGDKWDWRWQGTRWEWQGERERVWQEESADNWRRASQRERQRSKTDAADPPRGTSSHEHYAVLGLDPSRSYSQAEIKAAFRVKALEFHPDRNQANKAEAEKKFHKVMEAYNALKG